MPEEQKEYTRPFLLAATLATLLSPPIATAADFKPWRKIDCGKHMKSLFDARFAEYNPIARTANALARMALQERMRQTQSLPTQWEHWNHRGATAVPLNGWGYGAKIPKSFFVVPQDGLYTIQSVLEGKLNHKDLVLHLGVLTYHGHIVGKFQPEDTLEPPSAHILPSFNDYLLATRTRAEGDRPVQFVFFKRRLYSNYHPTDEIYGPGRKPFRLVKDFRPISSKPMEPSFIFAGSQSHPDAIDGLFHLNSETKEIKPLFEQKSMPHHYDVSPDGRGISFWVRKRKVASASRFELHKGSIQKYSNGTRVMRGTKSVLSSPKAAPIELADSANIGLIGEGTETRIINMHTGEDITPVGLTVLKTARRDTKSIVHDTDRNRLYFVASNQDAPANLYWTDINSGKTEPLIDVAKDGAVDEFSTTSGGRIVVATHDLEDNMVRKSKLLLLTPGKKGLTTRILSQDRGRYDSRNPKSNGFVFNGDRTFILYSELTDAGTSRIWYGRQVAGGAGRLGKPIKLFELHSESWFYPDVNFESGVVATKLKNLNQDAKTLLKDITGGQRSSVDRKYRIYYVGPPGTSILPKDWETDF